MERAGEAPSQARLLRGLALLWLAGCALRLTILAVPPVIPLIHADLRLTATEIGILTGLPSLLFAAAAGLMIADGPYGYHKVNAADQRRDPNSLLNWTERLVRMRKEVPELGWGDYDVIDVKNPGVLVMKYQWRNNAVVTVHNLLDENLEITLPLKEKLISLFDAAHSEPDGRHRHHIILEPYGYRWFRVGGLGYILDRTNY